MREKVKDWLFDTALFLVIMMIVLSVGGKILGKPYDNIPITAVAMTLGWRVGKWLFPKLKRK